MENEDIKKIIIIAIIVLTLAILIKILLPLVVIILVILGVIIVVKTLENGIVEDGDLLYLAGGREYIKGVKESKRIGGIVIA